MEIIAEIYLLMHMYLIFAAEFFRSRPHDHPIEIAGIPEMGLSLVTDSIREKIANIKIVLQVSADAERIIFR